MEQSFKKDVDQEFTKHGPYRRQRQEMDAKLLEVLTEKELTSWLSHNAGSIPDVVIRFFSGPHGR